MHITRYSDYALRVLIFLSADPGRLTTIQEIADSYDISKSHLMKVVHQLNRLGYIETIRGKNGGLRLQRDPADINIGVVFRETEQDMNLVECFAANNECRITPICGLKGVLAEARTAFLKTLDQYTLRDLVDEGDTPQLVRMLKIS